MFSLKVIGVMATGVLLGWIGRNLCRFAFLGKTIFCTVLLLLFWMGVEVGSNPYITQNIVRLGGQSLLLSAAGTLGSILLAKWVYSRFFSGSLGKVPVEEGESAGLRKKGPVSGTEAREDSREGSSWKSTLLTLGAFVLGCFIGYGVSLPEGFREWDISLYILYALTFC